MQPRRLQSNLNCKVWMSFCPAHRITASDPFQLLKWLSGSMAVKPAQTRQVTDVQLFHSLRRLTAWRFCTLGILDSLLYPLKKHRLLAIYFNNSAARAKGMPVFFITMVLSCASSTHPTLLNTSFHNPHLSFLCYFPQGDNTESCMKCHKVRVMSIIMLWEGLFANRH